MALIKRGDEMGAYRKVFLDPDNRYIPVGLVASDLVCCRCNKRIRSKAYRLVHLIDGGANVLHPEDADAYIPDDGDMDWHPIGPDCARKIGIEYTVKA